MNAVPEVAGLPVDLQELSAAAAVLVGAAPALRALGPSRYATSFPTHLVAVRGPAGEGRMLVKDLRWQSLSPQARRAKDRSTHDPARELGTYREVLRHDDGPPRYLGGRGDRRSSTAWIAMEHVEARELYQWGETEAWRAAAGWVGRFHRTWRERSAELAGVRRRVPLLNHDAAHLAGLATRVRAQRGHAPTPELAEVLAAWNGASQELLRVEPTIVHGECYASNVLVGDTGRVTVVDWETTAIGSGWGDLAALVVGWDRAAREQFLEEYLRSAGPVAAPVAPERLLDAARLGVCVQWLGADPLWAPPDEQQRDWLAEARSVIDGSDRPW
jgi:hypothetical protein